MKVLNFINATKCTKKKERWNGHENYTLFLFFFVVCFHLVVNCVQSLIEFNSFLHHFSLNAGDNNNSNYLTRKVIKPINPWHVQAFASTPTGIIHFENKFSISVWHSMFHRILCKNVKIWIACQSHIQNAIQFDKPIWMSWSWALQPLWMKMKF